MMLTTHFSLEEFTLSQTASRAGLDNEPGTVELRDNILRTAQLLERIRSLLGAPIIITSGYRSPRVNALVGGALNSAHMQGLAADFIAPSAGIPFDVCRAIALNVKSLEIDQLIYEHTWVHVGLRKEAPRNQILTLAPGAGYMAGIQMLGAAA